jgi:hypothetical protein
MGLLFASAVAWGLSGCAELPSAPRVESASLGLSGTWQLRLQPVSHGCPQLGNSLPFAPGAVELTLANEVLTVRDALEVTRRFESLGEGRFWQSEAMDLGACHVEHEVEVRIDRADGMLFVAGYESRFRHNGVEACEELSSVAACTIVHRVEGHRISKSPLLSSAAASRAAASTVGGVR